MSQDFRSASSETVHSVRQPQTWWRQPWPSLQSKLCRLCMLRRRDIDLSIRSWILWLTLTLHQICLEKAAGSTYHRHNYYYPVIHLVNVLAFFLLHLLYIFLLSESTSTVPKWFFWNILETTRACNFTFYCNAALDRFRPEMMSPSTSGWQQFA